MLHLADYGSSSDDDDDKIMPKIITAESNLESTPVNSMFSRLPEPEVVGKSADSVKTMSGESELEAEVTRKRAWMDEALRQQPPAKKSSPRSTSKKVQIFLPTFSNDDRESDSDDDEITPKTSRIENKSGSCGLLSVLPKPASSESSTLFLPKSTAKPSVDKTLLPSILPRQTESVNSEVNGEKTLKSSSLLPADYATDSDSDLDEIPTSTSDFFGLTSTSIELPTIQNYAESSDFDDQSADMNIDEPSSSTPVAVNHPSQMFNMVSASSAALEEHKSKADDMEYVKKLIYKNEIEKLNDGHSYVVPDDLEITDVRLDNHLTDIRENLLKNITCKPPDAMLLAAQMASGGPCVGSKKAKPDPKAKRKHQITYLAHLAQEREEVLQNQWAQNRERRREARMKYGFR